MGTMGTGPGKGPKDGGKGGGAPAPKKEIEKKSAKAVPAGVPPKTLGWILKTFFNPMDLLGVGVIAWIEDRDWRQFTKAVIFLSIILIIGYAAEQGVGLQTFNARGTQATGPVAIPRPGAAPAPFGGTGAPAPVAAVPSGTRAPAQTGSTAPVPFVIVRPQAPR